MKKLQLLMGLFFFSMSAVETSTIEDSFKPESVDNTFNFKVAGERVYSSQSFGFGSTPWKPDNADSKLLYALKVKMNKQKLQEYLDSPH